MIAEPPINPNPSSLPAFGGEHPRSVLVGVGLHRHEMVKHPQVHGFGIMNVLGRRVVAERHDLDPLHPMTRNVSGQRRSLQMHIPTTASKARHTLKPSLPTSK